MNKQWRQLHDAARIAPKGHEVAIVGLLDALIRYARLHVEAYHSPVGEDYVLGDHFAQIGLNIHGLLNGETGRLDCGTLERELVYLFEANGLDFYGTMEGKKS